ncbi:MAG: alpha/beta hydrolase [Actinomycetota bacterium]|nr:alpha/beta hydrolase [Actinomycetota bacterium]
MQIERGVIGQIPYAATGSGPPVVVLAGLSPTTGVRSDALVRAALGPVRDLGRQRRLIVVNRWAGLPEHLTMEALAAEHAAALQSQFHTPVDLIGTSTGGSIAQQLAADHPDTIRRLALLSTACRLGRHGRALQHQVASHLHAGHYRRAVATAAGALVPPRHGQHLAAAAGWILASRIITTARDGEDLAATIAAEDGFDLAKCHTQIQAPTLIIAGGRDRFYSPALFTETAQLIPNSQLRLFPHRGHLTVTRDRAALAALVGFLTWPVTADPDEPSR